MDLTLDIIEVTSCRRNLVVEVPAEQVENEITELARSYARRATVPGFRPGKVPLAVVRQRYRAELRSDATQQIVRRSWEEALKKHRLEPIDEPVLKDLSNEPGSPLRFTLSFEVLPSLEVTGYKQVTVTRTKEEVTEESVQAAIEALRERDAQFIPVEEGEIRDGHLVTMDVEGTLDEGGKSFREGNVVCIVGSPETDPAFSENLRGARQGETRSFEVAYPPDYHRKQYAGKRVRYSATIGEIKEKVLPEPEDLARELGSESLESLRTRLRDELVTKADRDAEKKARDAVLEEILQRNSVEVPQSLVEAEMREFAGRIAGNLARQGIDPGKASIDWRRLLEEERPNAEKAVRSALVLDAIARQEGIRVTDEELDAELEKIADGTRKPVAALRAQMEKDEQIQSFRDRLRRHKVLDFIYRNANINRG
ncbi:MAG: trigger factor [Acidobacteria bacterium]|nr:trigger factor [Acidobacteriota bacterium]